MLQGGYFFPDTRWFSFMLNLEKGTNDWAELRALASLLQITVEKEIVELQAFGDLRTVVIGCRVF